MSYIDMDHAAWVEKNNEAAKKLNWRRAPKTDSDRRIIGYAAAPDKLSEFQIKVFNILGIVGGGIYNAPINWKTVDWKHGGGVSLMWERAMQTFDHDALTTLVFLCHDARIRLEIGPANSNNLRLSFWQRTAAGTMMDRHPNLREAVARHREAVPLDHPIAYRSQEVVLEEAEVS